MSKPNIKDVVKHDISVKAFLQIYAKLFSIDWATDTKAINRLLEFVMDCDSFDISSASGKSLLQF